MLSGQCSPFVILLVTCCGIVLNESMVRSGLCYARSYCMGGALSLASNVLITEIDAAVAYYGTPNAALADPVKTKKPVQCHFGNNDVMKGFADPVVLYADHACLLSLLTRLIVAHPGCACRRPPSWRMR